MVLVGPKQSPPYCTEEPQHGCQLPHFCEGHPHQRAAGGRPSQKWGRGCPGLRAAPCTCHEVLFRGVDAAYMTYAQTLLHCVLLSTIAKLRVVGLSPSCCRVAHTNRLLHTEVQQSVIIHNLQNANHVSCSTPLSKFLLSMT